MAITVLLMTIMTGQNHTIVAEYNTAEACEVAALAHRKVLLENNSLWSLAVLPKRVHASGQGVSSVPSRVCEREVAVRGADS